MGCWNGTCGVTQLPITYGDPVALIFLVSGYGERYDAGHVYSNNYWSPCAFPVLGEYDDYGLVEDFEDTVTNKWNMNDIIRRIKNHVIEKPMGENEYHEQAVSIPGIETIDNLLDLIRDSRIDLKSHLTEPSKFGFMLVHKDIYESLCKEIPTWFDKIIGINVAVKQSMASYEKIRKIRKTQDKVDKIMSRYVDEEFDIHAPPDPIKSLFKDRFNSGNISALTTTIGFADYKGILEVCMDADIPADNEIVAFIIREYCKFVFFDVNFSLLRRTYMPQAGAGSQSQELSVYKKLNEAIALQIAKIENKYQEDETDDDDED